MTPVKFIPRGFPALIDNRNTDYATAKEVTMPPCIPHPALSEKVEEPKKVIDKYDVPYDEDFDAWFTRWEAQEAQRIIDGASIKYNEHGQEIDEDLEAYLGGIQMDISSGLCKRNTKGQLGLTDREEAGLEKKRRCLPPPPLLKPDTTDEAPKDTKYIAPAEPEKFGAPMQGTAATATVYQGLCDKIDREQNIKIEVKETAPKAMNAKNASPSVTYTGDDNTATKPPSDIPPTFSISQPISKPPGWPESLPPPPASSAWNSRRSSPPVQPPVSNSNGEELSAFYTPYAPGPVNKRGSNSLGGQRRKISSGFYEPGGQGNRQGNGGRAGYRGGRKGRKNRGHSHQRNR